jgi:glycosyltransferase involved in cell wall biosynthesis
MISVIVPAFNAAETLSFCLRSIITSEYRDFELIVVDDHSTDDTRAVARSLPCTLIEKSANEGAAAARNAGAKAATGSILFFVDADISIQPDSLRRIVTVFAEHPYIAALFGSYQAETPAPNFFSQYKNLLHHYIHQISSPQAKTFASGFGAVRTEVFKALGGFDPSRRFLEDIEFGYRMHLAGYRVLLDRQLQLTHHKRYTLASLARSDFFGRAVPWTRLMLEKRIFQNDLNTRVNNIVSVPVSLAILAAPVALLSVWVAGLVVLAIVIFVTLNRGFLAFLLRQKGLRFALCGAVMTWFAYVYSALGALVGLAGYALERWGKMVEPGAREKSAVAGRNGDLSPLKPAPGIFRARSPMAAETTLVRIAADWDCSNILRQTPGGSGLWESIRFTIDPVPECDYLFMFNNRRLAPLEVRCPRDHVWCMIQEPYIPVLFDWMVEGHEAFARVFTHHVPSADPKYIRSYPILPWLVGRSYDELVSAKVPDKTRNVSWIASNLTLLRGHRKRNALRAFLLRKRPQNVDIFGRGVRYIEDKWDALAPYRYSLAIENSSSPDYWTEKVADCFLSWTLPLYDGCTNLEDYFDPESFIRIDARDHAGTLRRIEELCRSDEWERRMPAIAESRRRVLSEYQLFPAFARIIKAYGTAAGARETIRIAGYQPARRKHRWRYLAALLREGKVGELIPFITSKLHYLRWNGIQSGNP